MPAITVVIPSYNHARFLPECLDSIQAQTFEDWSLILVDDGSTDESVDLARDYARADPRIRVEVNPNNLGTYGTEQRGLGLTESEFVAVMNSDDLWALGKLEAQVRALRAHPNAPLCYVLGGMIDDTGREMEDEDVHLGWPRAEVQDVLPYLLYENRILASGVLFRREGLRFETSCRYSGDWVALLERAYTGPVVCVPEGLTFWRQHDNNTYRISPKQLLEEIRVREAIKRHSARWFLPRLDARLVRRGLRLNAMNLVSLYAYFYDRRAARRAGLAALRYGDDRKSALKRTLGSFLPAETFRNHFWNEEQKRALNVPVEEVAPLLASNPSLDLRLSS